MKKYLLILIPFIYSCNNLKFYNSSDYYIEKKIIFSKLKKQKVRTKNIFLNEFNEDYFIGVYTIGVDSWKGVKSGTNEISIPLLLINEDYFINAYFINGHLREGFKLDLVEQEIDSVINLFRKNYQMKYNQEEFLRIEKYYRQGVNVSSKGRLWMN